MKIKTTQFPGEDITYLTPTWDEMNQLAFKISQQMIKDNLHFDRIVTLAKGGWPITRSMVDFLSVDQVASLGIKFYSGINKRLPKPEIYQDLPVDIKGENILLFDDVADTGESLIFAKDYLGKQNPQSITTASLFYKPHSKLKPDYFGNTTDVWIIFPYDSIETIHLFGPKWGKIGLSRKEIIHRFNQLNIPADWVKAYFD